MKGNDEGKRWDGFFFESLSVLIRYHRSKPLFRSHHFGEGCHVCLVLSSFFFF